MQNNELCHYGVAGMKWGVRKRLEYRHGSNRSYRTDRDYSSTPRAKTTKTRAATKKTVNKTTDDNDYLPITNDTYNKILKGAVTATKVMSLAGAAASVYITQVNVSRKMVSAVGNTLNLIGEIKAVDLIKKS